MSLSRAAKLAAALGGDDSEEESDDSTSDVDPHCVELFKKLREAITEEDDEKGAAAFIQLVQESSDYDDTDKDAKKPLAALVIAHKD